MAGNEAWKTNTLEDEIEVQQCDNCATPYSVAYSQTLERWIFICLNCSASCSTIVLESGEEIEIR